MLTYSELSKRWKALRSQRDIRVREVACVGAPRTLLCAELGAHDAPAIALAAGVHGDEPAGAFALLKLVEDNLLNPEFSYRIWPCTNPSGFEAGTRCNVDGMDVNRTFGRGGQSPEARAIITSNRDRKFALSIDLHEDCDAEGFYCYEYRDGNVGRAAAAAVAREGFPLQALGVAYDLGYAMPPQSIAYEPGIVLADPVVEGEVLGGLSYTLAVARRAAAQVLTFETPQRLPLDDRIAMHCIAVGAAIGAVQP